MCVCVCVCQELEEQAVELEEMYSKRMTLLEHSVKKQATRKRKRIHDGTPCVCVCVCVCV